MTVLSDGKDQRNELLHTVKEMEAMETEQANI